MQLFVDTANLAEIESALKLGIISGITTNPSLLAKEPKTEFLGHIKKIISLCRKYEQEPSLSVEVFTTDPDKMIEQAEDFVKKLDYKNLTVKIPMGWEELRVIKTLSDKGIAVNCTCGFAESQAILAAQAGARYFSLFYNRLKDINGDANDVVSKIAQVLQGYETEQIIGSIRHMNDVTEAFLSGADIVTAGYGVIKKMAYHPKTDESIQGFLDDFAGWLD